MIAVGTLATATGACPVCGHDVHFTHSFNGIAMTDSYACYRCGPTVYTVPVLN